MLHKNCIRDVSEENCRLKLFKEESFIAKRNIENHKQNVFKCAQQKKLNIRVYPHRAKAKEKAKINYYIDSLMAPRSIGVKVKKKTISLERNKLL